MKDAGIVGCGGAGFPTYIKYQGAKDCHTVLINGVECEPYITADANMMEKYTKELFIIYGEHLKSVILYGSYANVKKEEVGLYRLE